MIGTSPSRQVTANLLGPCITKFVGDVNIKECAKRSAWLGNDETHYTREWETKDIGDLKVLVRLTVNWIENSTLTKKYINEHGSAACCASESPWRTTSTPSWKRT